MSGYTTKKLMPLIGLEITAPKEVLIAGTYGKEFADLLEPNGILVFRDAHLDDEEQLTFSKSLGEITIHETMKADRGLQKISLDESVSASAEYLKGSLFWHIDGWYDKAPNKGAVLGARKLPKEGGNTLFSNTHTAWEALPEERKTKLKDLKVVHSMVAAQSVVYPQPSKMQLDQWKAFGSKTHPLVWTHESGLESLVLGCTASHIEGMDILEGRELLWELLDWSTQDQFTYTHEWRAGDMVVWDNTVTLHKVTPYDPKERLMTRVTLHGTEEIA